MQKHEDSQKRWCFAPLGSTTTLLDPLPLGKAHQKHQEWDLAKPQHVLNHGYNNKPQVIQILAFALAGFFLPQQKVKLDSEGKPRPARLWTSSLKRTRLTARHIRACGGRRGGGWVMLGRWRGCCWCVWCFLVRGWSSWELFSEFGVVCGI